MIRSQKPGDAYLMTTKCGRGFLFKFSGRRFLNVGHADKLQYLLCTSIGVSKFIAVKPFFLLCFPIGWKTQAFLGALTKKDETLIW